MGEKSEQNACDPFFPGSLHQLPKDPLMPFMDAVEGPDGESVSSVGGEFRYAPVNFQKRNPSRSREKGRSKVGNKTVDIPFPVGSGKTLISQRDARYGPVRVFEAQQKSISEHGSE
jgi:hypothetical protein